MTEDCSQVAPLLSAWLDGELDAPSADQVHRHVGGCALCAADLESLAATRSLLRSLPVRRLAEPVGAAALRAAREPEPRPRPRPRAVLYRALAGAAVATSMVAGIAFGLGASAPPPDRTVEVPVDVFVVDHLVYGTNGPVATPVVLERSP